MNDTDRRLWVENDEGLYNLCRTSGKSQKTWISENRDLIDELVKNVTTEGTKPAHYLEYQL